MQPTVQVLVVAHSARLGGAELALLRLCRAVDRNAFGLRVLCLEDGELVRRLQALSVDVHVMEPSGSWVTNHRASTRSPGGAVVMALGSTRQAWRLARLVREVDPDVVHSWTLKTHLVATLARPMCRRPLVWFLHDRLSADYLGRLNAAVVRTLARAATLVIVNSVATGRTVGRPTLLAYPGLAPEQYRDPGPGRAAASPPELLLLGRISPTKGQREAILALPRILSSFPDTRLRIVGAPLFGEEGYEAECRDLAARLGVSHAVDFAGGSADPTQDLDRATALVHASPVPEPFGQVVAEAMARGVPVIGTAAGGVSELLLGDGSDACGLLTLPGDPASLAEAAVDVLSRPEAAAARAARAYDRARTSFTIQQTADVVEGAWLTAATSRR